MSQTVIKPSEQTNSLNKDFVIQVTKTQLIRFLQFIVIICMLILNIVAIKTSSPFLKDLFISQAILLLVFCIKNAHSNNISK
ncbi:hypothetical protein BST83_04005 [Polaribacter filamentus]|uniref:Uncharacterized protein n=1 Tax=Polaribacter filamentus TaxID=53483 RepID=A0A2S7KUZ0_9FLAO|nr:hypothetical protein [Polaribacter filamentus]PQB06430.1 hypothetical protein BST83_04005 [Polaribacter filamentus]